MMKILIGIIILCSLMFATEDCNIYLKKADKYMEYAESKAKSRIEEKGAFLGGPEESMHVSTLAMAFMKRYEICLEDFKNQKDNQKIIK